jgi:hypothetical protein
VGRAYKEYELFSKDNEEQLKDREHYRPALETRFIALLAGKPEDLELEDYKLPEPFRPWKKRIFSKAHFLQLPPNKNEFEDVMRKLEAAVIHRAYRIIESVPTDG